MRNRLILIIVGLITAMAANASLKETMERKMILNHLDVGVTAGTSGLGLHLAAPVTEYARVRAGVDWLPRFAVPMTFDIGTYQEFPDDVVTPEQREEWLDSRFAKISDLMYQISGIRVDREVKMKANGRLFDFKFLVDIYPWKHDRRWHFTVGFHWGASRVAHAENAAEAMPALLAMKMYNNMYDYILKTDFIETPLYKDFYVDPELAEKLKDKMLDEGRVGVHVGYNKADGSKFMMEPGTDGMVKADMIVHKFKPYVGFGYDAPISKDGRWRIGFDAGLLFWGSPKMITHAQPVVGYDPVSGASDVTMTTVLPDGTTEPVYATHDLINDVRDIDGKVGSYVSFASFMKVYPVINFKLSFNIF